MNRRLVALFSALEALLVVGVGIGLPLVPLTLMWAFQYGLQVDWAVFWRAAVDVWLAGHGVDVALTLDPVAAAATGLAGAANTFELTIAPLGFAVLTVFFGIRAGRRVTETPHPRIGALVAIGTFAALALAATLTAVVPEARPSLVQGILFPPVIFAAGIAIGVRRAWSAHHDKLLMRRVPAFDAAANRLDDRWPVARPLATIAATGAGAAVAHIMVVAAIALAIMLGTHYGEIIALYEGVQAGLLGGVALTIGQLGFIPNLVVWTAAWMIGPGFAVGAGSTVSPIVTSLAPIPAVPMLGALPSAELPFAVAWILVPVLAGFVSGLVMSPRLTRAGLDRPLWRVVCGAATGILGGALLGVFALMSGGAAGPGRLVTVGPNPWAVASFAALEIAIPFTLALFVSALSPFSRGTRELDEERAPLRQG